MMNTIDTEGLVGNAGDTVTEQQIIDVLADKVLNRLVNKNMLTQSLGITTAGTTVLDGTVGKTLNDAISELNSKLDELSDK